MKYIKILALLYLALAIRPAQAQDVSFSQTFEAPLYLAPSFTGLANGTRVGLTYRNQWPGIGNVYQNYYLYADYYFDQYNSGVGIQWLCDNQGKGLVVDNQVSLMYAYELQINKFLMLRPGISFHLGIRNLDRSKMISYTDISSDGSYQPGGSSIEFESLRKTRFDAGTSLMLYSDIFWVGFTIDHLLQPDNSFTDARKDIGMKITGFAGYKLIYEESRRGSEPKSISFALNYTHQYSFNQMEMGFYWYYYPLELGLSYRGLFFKVSGELDNSDAVIPNVGVNINGFRIGYSYDITISDLSSFGNGAHEVSLLYRIIPENKNKRKYKMSPVPCTMPIMGYPYTGSSVKKKPSMRRKVF